jgi:hypothetical protein
MSHAHRVLSQAGPQESTNRLSLIWLSSLTTLSSLILRLVYQNAVRGRMRPEPKRWMLMHQRKEHHRRQPMPHYPALQRAADDASHGAQRTFLLLNKIQLILLVAATFASGWDSASISIQRYLAIATSIFMLVVLAISSALRIGRFDERWFRCRIFAEHARAAVWFFITSPSREVARKEYFQAIRNLRQELPDLAREFTVDDSSEYLITDWMQASQALPVHQKITLYEETRLNNQITWYRAKGQLHLLREKQWFWTIFITEFFALGCSAIQAWLLWHFDLVGGIAALSASFVSWSQTKRFSDLGTSYAVAADDLRRTRKIYDEIEKDVELEQLVKQVEMIISREHAMWRARRVC